MRSLSGIICERPRLAIFAAVVFSELEILGVDAEILSSRSGRFAKTPLPIT